MRLLREPRLRTRDGRYYIVFYNAHQSPAQKWVTLGTHIESQAMDAYSSLRREYLFGTYDPWTEHRREQALTVSEVAARFLRRPELRPNSKRSYRGVLDCFIQSLPAGILLDAVGAEHINKFIEQRNLAKSSRASYYRQLRAFFNWATEAGYLRTTPFSRMKAPRVGRLNPPFLSKEDLGRLLRAAEADAQIKCAVSMPAGNRWFTDAVLFAVATGFRLGEIVHLRWMDVSLEHGTVSVTNRGDFESKSGHDRTIPLVASAREVIMRLDAQRAPDKSDAADSVFRSATGGRLSAGYLSERFRFYRRLAKLDDRLHFHSLRHTTASWLAMAGVPIQIIAEILGHRSLKVTEGYAHLSPDSLYREMLRAFGDANLEIDGDAGVRNGAD